MSDQKKISFPTSSEESEPSVAESTSGPGHEAPPEPVAPAATINADSNAAVGLEPLLQLASQLKALDFHPVVIVGNSFSGKTSLITSLLAALKLEADWEVGANLKDPVLPQNTDIGRKQHEDATRIFNKVVQEFIAGKGAEKTQTTYPFFIPISLRSGRLGQTLNVAFLESNGEAYTPRMDSDRFFADLQEVTETFIRDFQGGISFIYVLPYTQVNVRGLNEDLADDPNRLRLAEHAIVGVLQAYDTIRMDKSKDRHLLLVSKWDAHLEKKKIEEQITIGEVLLDTHSDIRPFLRATYPQALASFNALSVDQPQRQITNYCSGLMTGRKVQPTGADPEISQAIRSHQKKLWSWIWSSASGYTVSPFPEPVPPSPIDRFFRWLTSWL
jgi:hypothetical protein